MFTSLSSECAFGQLYDTEMNDQMIDVTVPQFFCMGKISNSENIFHPNSYVCSQELDFILNNHDPQVLLYEDESICLFNKHFVFEEAFFSDMDLLLDLARNMYGRIETGAQGNQIYISGLRPSAMRRYLNDLMGYFRVYTYRFLNGFGREEYFSVFYEKLSNLIKEVSSWSSCVAEMPTIVFSDGSLNNDSFVGVLFHVYFDIQWSLIEMAYMAVNLQKYSQCNRKFRDNFSEVLLSLQEDICSDLIYLGFRKFSDLTPNDWSGSPPFSCTCIRELWFMLQMMIKTESSFHSFILRRYQSLVDNSAASGFCQDFREAKKLQLSSKDPLTLLWICSHVSKLSGFSLTGTWDSNFSRVEPNYEVVNKLVQFYFTNCASVSEDRTRGLLGCLYSLSQLWGPNLNLCILLWDHFSKKFDDSFSVSSSFDSLPYSSCTLWYEHLTATIEPWKALTNRYNSYFMFLRLLGHQMELMSPKNQSSLKARLYVKFQGKKMLELSQVGLYHVMSACLIVSLSTQSSDMCAKILEMSENGKKKQIFFVAELVLLLICVRRGSDCHDVVASISIQLEKVSRALMEGDVVARDEQRKFGTQFVEAFQEVAFHSNNCLLGQLKLIDKSLKNYLKHCGNCDRFAVIDALTNLLRKMRNTPAHNDIYNAISTHIVPLMKEKFIFGDEYATFLSELTITALESSRAEFPSLFSFFCLDERVNPKLSLKYLSQLLKNNQFIPSLSLSLNNYQTILIQSWFRISFLIPASLELKEDMDALNSVVRRLPRMAELAIQSQIKFNQSDEMILSFLQMISSSFQKIQNYNERIATRETYLQYIGPMDKYLSCANVTTNWEPSDQAEHILRLGGDLFFHCGNIIYTKGKADCLLAQLNQILIIPMTWFDLSKELPSTLITALQQYLPLYVFGLFRLNPSREPYILRCLNGIFQVYMTRYQSNHSHPLTRCWIGIDNVAVTNSLVPVVRNWLLNTICSSVLPQKVAKTSLYLQPTLQWLKFLSTNKEWRVEIFSSILLPILELALILDEVASKRGVTEFLQYAVSPVCDPSPPQSKIVEDALKELIDRHLAFNSNRLFKLLEVISVLNNQLVKQILPRIKELVVITEAKRGIGVDSTLRQYLGTLEITLGISSD